MFRKNLISFLCLVLALTIALSACSASPITSLFSLPQTLSVSTSQQLVTSKLAIGLLKMEGTSQAVTSAQASELLPLWKAVYILGNDKNASKIEVAALYDQIQESLTTDQVATIQKLAYTQQELSDLTVKYGSTTSGKSASSSTSLASSSNQGGAGGPPDMGGGPMGDILSVGSSSAQTSSSQTSSSAKGSKTSSTTTDLNPVFASAIVTILKHRTGLE